jgi:hypothetical protein
MKYAERWWRVTDREKQKYSERNLSQYHFVHHKSHTNWSRIETKSARLEAGIAAIVSKCVLCDFHTYVTFIPFIADTEIRIFALFSLLCNDAHTSD